jgi:hypothetical protein
LETDRAALPPDALVEHARGAGPVTHLFDDARVHDPSRSRLNCPMSCDQPGTPGKDPDCRDRYRASLQSSTHEKARVRTSGTRAMSYVRRFRSARLTPIGSRSSREIIARHFRGPRISPSGPRAGEACQSGQGEVRLLGFRPASLSTGPLRSRFKPSGSSRLLAGESRRSPCDLSRSRNPSPPCFGGLVMRVSRDAHL